MFTNFIPSKGLVEADKPLVSSLHQELFIIKWLFLFCLFVLKMKKRNMGRQGIEITLNLDIDCGNHSKDLHFRPVAKNVLLTVYHQEEMFPFGRESRACFFKLQGD